MPTCSSCGTVTTEEAHFCPRCGASLKPPARDFDSPSQAEAPPAASPWQQPQASGQPAPYYGPQRTNGMAVASLVLGILWLLWVGSILALVFGYVGKRQIERSGGAEGGRGLAIAGIVLGWVGVGTLVLTIVLGIIGAVTDNSSSQLSLP